MCQALAREFWTGSDDSHWKRIQSREWLEGSSFVLCLWWTFGKTCFWGVMDRHLSSLTHHHSQPWHYEQPGPVHIYYVESFRGTWTDSGGGISGMFHFGSQLRSTGFVLLQTSLDPWVASNNCWLSPLSACSCVLSTRSTMITQPHLSPSGLVLICNAQCLFLFKTTM